MVRNLHLIWGASLGLLLLGHPFSYAQTPGSGQGKTMNEDTKAKRIFKQIAPPVTTSGSVSIAGKTIDYQAVTGALPILSADALDTLGMMSFTAYLKKGENDLTKRPITFLYNGGPGSATVWLHMGSFGPKRIIIDSTNHMGGAPYQLVNNEYSLLDASDLVFIDAPGTGFGRVLPDHGKDFFGVDQDAKAFAQFIVRFITQYNRWNSPKFLFGESYGTTRSAVLAGVLQEDYSIDLNGVILLSQILNFANSVDGASDNPGNDLPYQLALPTYAATAWYHKKLPQQPTDLTSFLSEVEQFAMNDYALALSKGTQIDQNTFKQIAQKLHQYTGLPLAYIKKANLRIDGAEFEQNLLGDEDMSTGRLDTRFSGPSLNPLAQGSGYDPMAEAVGSAYVSSYNDYVRNTLKYGQNQYYRPNIYGKMHWDWHRGNIGSINVMPDLGNTMIMNPKLQVLLATGYFDLATPFYEGVYELQHLAIPQQLSKNIHFAFYESGHMVYLHVPSLKKLHDDVSNFIRDNAKGN